eukprot:TRINITY_DN28920_c0_g1_i1.p1 TRINITY_DN28920_c0_g1~~TRINITY_DN28920_c0_g1_i1.p1  ORF type:complete len:202 (+),score=52.26 TRINITY_DN28920_c0_g1_i1:39-608(+)
MEGLMILSRFPILKHDFILLSKAPNEDENQRICEMVEINVPGINVPVQVFNTHISFASSIQELQGKEIAEWMTKLKHTHKQPPLQFLTGDVNCDPGGLFHQGFFRHVDDDIADSFDTCRNSSTCSMTFPKISDPHQHHIDTNDFGQSSSFISDTNQELGHTFPSTNPHKRIDVIFHSKSVTPTLVSTQG